MALVERGDAAGSEAVGEHDDGEIGETGREVGVARFELRYDAIILRPQALDDIPPGTEVLEERTPSRVTAAAGEQVVDLGRDRRRKNEVAGIFTKELTKIGT